MIDLSTETIAELAFREVSRLTKETLSAAAELQKELKEIEYNKQFFY